MFEKIVCIGDSITKGKVWRENEKRPCIVDESYPYLLKKMIKLTVFNNGICDITSEGMLQHILESSMEFDNDSAVIIEIGGNDCNPNWKQVKKNPDGEHDAAVNILDFKQNVLKIIDIVRQNGAIPILSTLPPLDGDKYYNLLKRVFTDRIKPWIDRNGGIYKWQEKYSDAVKDIASATGTYLIDIRNAFLELPDYRKFISIDGIHPNEAGYRIIANSYYNGLKVLFNM